MKDYKIVLLLFSLLFITSCTDEEVLINENLDCDKFYDIRDDSLLVDVRTKEEYDEFNLDGSINIPLDSLENISDYASFDDSIIVYCRSGVRSLDALLQLVEMGYTKVSNLGSVDKCES